MIAASLVLAANVTFTAYIPPRSQGAPVRATQTRQINRCVSRVSRVIKNQRALRVAMANCRRR